MACSWADFETIEQRIADAEQLVVRQEKIITRLALCGGPTAQAEDILTEFNILLAFLRAHRQQIWDDLGREAYKADCHRR